MILLLLSMFVCHAIFIMALKPTMSILNSALVTMIIETTISDKKFKTLQTMHLFYIIYYSFIYAFIVLLPIFLFGYDNNLLFVEFFSKIYTITFGALFGINFIVHLYNDKECLVPKFSAGILTINTISIFISYVAFVRNYNNYLFIQNSFQ